MEQKNWPSLGQFIKNFDSKTINNFAGAIVSDIIANQHEQIRFNFFRQFDLLELQRIISAAQWIATEKYCNHCRDTELDPIL